MASVLLAILLILLGGKLGGEAAQRLGQPAVAGELIVGVLLAASLLGGYVGMPDFALDQEGEHAAGEGVEEAGTFFQARGAEWSLVHVLEALATLGVVLLLFQVGLESDLEELRRVGRSSLLVAFIGIGVSFAVGFAFSWGLAEVWPDWQAAQASLPPHLLHVFVGATLTATSVGITARVLGDLGQVGSDEAKVILGAAVLDDIGGLIILAIVAAMVEAVVSGGSMEGAAIAWIAVKAVGFLVLAVALGQKAIPRAYDGLVTRFQVTGFPVALAIAFALAMAWLAELAGLADIVGAFAGGLLLGRAKHADQVFADLRPIAGVLVGFFFVTLGMKVDLTQLGGAPLVILAAGLALAIVAVLAKLSCAWGVLKDANASRLVVGVGMVPRGEVGLIFAVLGLESGLLANWQYTAIVLVVLATTLITPMWLKRLQGSFRSPPQPGRLAVAKTTEA